MRVCDSFHVTDLIHVQCVFVCVCVCVCVFPLRI